ncbi:hypothetical protein KSP39_PZI020692 [Platanthera zijinensis]|uniref:Uncharacterized protein n=1 Tax=Platanthera zijinensis TaxID=2320716 RepID=A0AAP0AZ71_9ASPA
MPLLRSLALYYRHNLPRSSRYAHPPPPPVGIAAAFHRRNYLFSKREKKREIKSNNIKPSLPPLSFYNWAKWILGSMLAVAWPFWNKSWKSLLKLEDEVEMVTDAVETAAVIVEKAATIAEKVSSDIAEGMPDGDGRLKNAILFVEKAAKEVAEEAHLTQDIIHNVDQLKEEMEALIKPIKREDAETKGATRNTNI